MGYDPQGPFTRLPAMSNQDDLAALTPAQWKPVSQAIEAVDRIAQHYDGCLVTKGRAPPALSKTKAWPLWFGPMIAALLAASGPKASGWSPMHPD